jgi:hypothetical protein
MSKDKNKRLEEKEKIDAEIARSLSVVDMKKTHMQIEEIEKTRKKSSITSIIERIDLINKNIRVWNKTTQEITKKYTNADSSKLGQSATMTLDMILKTYESIRRDLQRNCDCKGEDFEKLFPKLTLNLETYGSASMSLTCLSLLLDDMKAYCKRLI